MPITKNAQYRYKILDECLRKRHGYTISELTDIVNDEMVEYESDGNSDKSVTEKTIRNDLKNISKLYNVEIISRYHRYFYKNSDDTIDNVNLKAEDKVAIKLAVEVFNKFKGTPLYDKFSDAITRMITSSVLRTIHTRDTRKYIHISEAGDDTGVQWIERIYDAIIEKQPLTMHYKNFGEKVSVKTISPCVLKEHRNKWYMLAHLHGRPTENVLMYKLGRIQALEFSGDAYFECTQFNADRYFKHTLGVFHAQDSDPVDVVLKVRSKNIVKLLTEEKIHPTQENASISEEEMLVRFNVFHTPELENMIFSWGENVEVIEPKSLRVIVAERVAKMHLLYL